MVVYFYPSAYTAGCNIQAHEFSTKADQFAAAGATVIGVSLDSIERLNEFSADPDYCAGKLAVASDGDGKIARAFGLQVSGAQRRHRHAAARRSTTASPSARPSSIQRDGTVLAAVGGVSPEDRTLRARSSWCASWRRGGSELSRRGDSTAESFDHVIGA